MQLLLGGLLPGHLPRGHCLHHGQTTATSPPHQTANVPQGNVLLHCWLSRRRGDFRSKISNICDFIVIDLFVQDCVRREVAEEVGIEVESIKYQCSQHWPFPAGSLMIGEEGHT